MSTVVNLLQYRNILQIEPASILPILEPVLTYQYRKYVHNPTRRGSAPRRGGSPMVIEPRRLYWFEGERLYTFHGLLSRIYHYLMQRGYKVSYFNYNQENPNCQPDFSALERYSLDDTQRQIVEAIHKYTCGVIKAPMGYGKTYLIRAICAVFHNARIAVVTTKRELAVQIYNRLVEDFGVYEIGRVWSGYSEFDRRVQVVLRQSLGKTAPNLFDLLLFDEVHSAAAPKTAEVLTHFSRAKMFGFSATPMDRTDGSNILIEAFFGPIIYEISYQEAERLGRVVPIEVWVYNTGDCNVKLKDNDYQSLQRYGIQRNDCRNRRIASIVRAIEADDPNQQILILCDTAIHLFHLHQFLPDYRLVYDSISETAQKYLRRSGLLGDAPTKMSEKALDEISEAFSRGEIKKAISTGVWDTGFDAPALKYVVRADGRDNKIANLQRCRATRPHEGKDIGILIDLFDDFHPTLLNRSRRRLSSYAKLGWKIVRK